MSNLLLLLGFGLVIKAGAGAAGGARFLLETFVNNDECWLGSTAFGFNLLFNTEVVVLLRLSELPLLPWLPWLPLLFMNDDLLFKIPEFVLPEVEEVEDEEEDGRFLWLLLKTATFAFAKGTFVEGVAALALATLIDSGEASCCCDWCDWLESEDDSVLIWFAFDWCSLYLGLVLGPVGFLVLICSGWRFGKRHQRRKIARRWQTAYLMVRAHLETRKLKAEIPSDEDADIRPASRARWAGAKSASQLAFRHRTNVRRVGRQW